jgi:hypothetical protein
MTACPVPDCTGTPPPRCVFCPNCYFRIPRAYTNTVHRVMFECERALDPETKAYLSKQLNGYIQVCIRSIDAPKPGEDAFSATENLVEEHRQRRRELLDQLAHARSHETGQATPAPRAPGGQP